MSSLDLSFGEVFINDGDVERVRSLTMDANLND